MKYDDGYDEQWHGRMGDDAPAPLFLVAGIVLIVQWLLGRKKESAVDILKQRYARGEIDKAVFERMKKDIGEGP